MAPTAMRVRAMRGQAVPLALIAAAIASGLAFATGAIATPDVSGALSDTADALGAWTYLVVPMLALLETGAFVGLVVPGETAIVVGGVVAARGDVEAVPLLALVWIGAVAGDLTSFLLGRRLGPQFLDRHGPRFRVRVAHIERVQRFFDQHGGKAVLVGRFVGVVRALNPFVAGTVGFPLWRFLPYTLLGALGWAAAFTFVGYAFAESFESASETATRVALAAALALAAVFVLLARLRRARRGHANEPDGGEGRQGAEARAEQRPGEHVERVVHAQINPRQRNGCGEREDVGSHARAEDRDCGRRGKSGGGVPGGEGVVPGDRDQGSEPGVGLGRARSPEQLLERGDRQGRRERGRCRGDEGERRSSSPQVAAEAEANEEWSLDPPCREDDEEGGQQRLLESRGDLDQGVVELEEFRQQGRWDASNTARLLVVVNGRASAVGDPGRTATELGTVLAELDVDAEAVITTSEADLFEALRGAAATGRRVVLVGGDGSLHAAANASLGRLPELALVPAGRANNIARALGIPTERAAALALAARASVRPLDALRVSTPDRTLYAVEAVSAGFHAEARSGYDAPNSADLRQGVLALGRAVIRFAPYPMQIRLDGMEVAVTTAAQLFLSNLPYFGFGFEVDPGADPGDGRLEAIVIEAEGRAELLGLLAATYRGAHLRRPNVRRIPARHAELTAPLPLVADAVPLGTTTADVSIEPARLRIAAPASGGPT
jgi:membrane-associated protein